MPVVPGVPATGATSDEAIDDAGRQWQPELADVASVTPPEPVPDDLALLDDDEAPLPVRLDRRLRRTARFASLDPDDGIAL